MKTKAENEVTLQFPSQSSNEGFIRSAVACFARDGPHSQRTGGH